MIIRAGIITVSDRGARGERKDLSGEAIKDFLLKLPAEVIAYDIVPDEIIAIRNLLLTYVDVKQLDLIFTTGGTGLSPRDVTPEATREVLDKEIPGLAETMRREGSRYTPFSMLSRALAGVRGQALIVNLPGSPKAVKENLEILLPVLAHALEKIKGDPGECARGDDA